MASIPMYLGRKEAADYIRSLGLCCSKNTLDKMATVGGGPVFRKFGSRVVYTVEDLDLWVSGRLSGALKSTSTLA